MRTKAREILFKELENSGYEWVLFNEEKPMNNNGIVECVLDAMLKFKNGQKPTVANKPKFICRLHVKRKNCKDYLHNEWRCKICPHNILNK